MPLKPRFIHPVRQVRACLGYSQPAFAKLIGCSAPAIQRIENGTLPLSLKLANSIMEATGADPATLRGPRDGIAMAMSGGAYKKDSLKRYKTFVPLNDDELRRYLHTLIRYLELLLIASNRGGKFKTHAVNFALQDSFLKIAKDFGLEEGIHSFLTEKGSVAKRIYRVGDLRKFPEYARLLGFKDNKRFKADKRVPFSLPHGWIRDFFVLETLVLPTGADMKLRPGTYILDDERPIPEVVKEVVSQALYWEINEFRKNFCEKPAR